MNGYLSSGRPYGYLPSGDDEEFVPEEEPMIEGEFRYVPVEEEPVSRPTGEAPDIEEARRRRRATRLGEEYEEERVRAAIAKQKLEREKLAKERTARRKAQYELGKAKREEGFRTAGRVAKAFAPAGAPGGAAQFYLGRPGKGLYVPSTPSAERLKEIPAKRALQPRLDSLRREGTLPQTSATPRVAVHLIGAQPVDYGLLRSAGRLRSEGPLGALVAGQLSGTSRLEQAVFAEVQANGDVDTLEHIKGELVQLGYGGPQIERAVQSLEQKGFIEKQKAPLGGSAEYVVR